MAHNVKVHRGDGRLIFHFKMHKPLHGIALLCRFRLRRRVENARPMYPIKARPAGSGTEVALSVTVLEPAVHTYVPGVMPRESRLWPANVDDSKISLLLT